MNSYAKPTIMLSRDDAISSPAKRRPLDRHRLIVAKRRPSCRRPEAYCFRCRLYEFIREADHHAVARRRYLVARDAATARPPPPHRRDATTIMPSSRSDDRDRSVAAKRRPSVTANYRLRLVIEAIIMLSSRSDDCDRLVAAKRRPSPSCAAKRQPRSLLSRATAGCFSAPLTSRTAEGQTVSRSRSDDRLASSRSDGHGGRLIVAGRRPSLPRRHCIVHGVHAGAARGQARPSDADAQCARVAVLEPALRALPRFRASALPMAACYARAAADAAVHAAVDAAATSKRERRPPPRSGIGGAAR